MTTFSAATIWEIAIKSLTRRRGFDADAAEVRRTLLETGWHELTITAAHAAATCNLPVIHSDPFDRILAAQAQLEGLRLVTADQILAQYSSDIIRV